MGAVFSSAFSGKSTRADVRMLVDSRYLVGTSITSQPPIEQHQTTNSPTYRRFLQICEFLPLRMSNLRILGDSAVHKLLINLSKNEIVAFKQELGKALRDFAVGEERSYQPPPGVINRPTGEKILFRPFTSPTSIGTKIVADPAAVPNSKGGLHGIIAVCDNQGLPTGVINAEEVTGYRTSLCALIPYAWRRHTENIVVFGAGKQALWHIRLALGLRGSEIKKITVINRSEERTQSLLDTVRKENDELWKSPAKLESFGSGPDAGPGLEALLLEADAVFCTVPSKSPLFPSHYVTSERKRQPYISAIGSWQPDMIELEPEILRHATKAPGAYHPAGGSGGAVIVDDSDHTFAHTGEVIQSELKPEQLVEVGKIWDIKEKGTEEKQLDEWLAEGFVVYKGIGVSVTDLAAGDAILKFAKERNLGTVITDF